MPKEEKEYVTVEECKEYREKIEEKVLNIELKFVELESNLKHIQATLNLMLGAFISIGGSIIVILLTRGIK